MRNLISLFAFLLSSSSALQVPSIFTPFIEPYSDGFLPSVNETSKASEAELAKRQLGTNNNCPVNFNACLQNGYGGACCTAGSFCTTDVARNVACCPTGATCTGTLNGAPALNTGTVTSSNVFGAPTTASITPAPTGIAPTGVAPTVVTNAFFPFPVIPVTYANSAACNVAYQACQTNNAACLANLQGGGFGVTVVAPNGGGVTLAPAAQNLGPASATSICSSLSAQACFNIQSANCAQFGGAATGNYAARQTAGCMAAGVVAMGLGIAGQMI